MKALIAVKRVVDHNVKVKVKDDGSGLDIAHVKMAINPFDEVAVEEAVRLKEAGSVNEIVTVSIGPEATAETLRTTLAMGADRALQVVSKEVLEPLTIAKILEVLVRREKPQLIFLGKQAIDDDANQVGQMLAGLLNVPQATFASAIAVKKDGIEVVREVDGGRETVALSLPAVVTADLRLNEPRFVKLPNIMAAKKKPLEKMEASSLGVDLTPKLEKLAYSEPPPRAAGIKVESVADLVARLKNEAKVL